MAAFLERHAAHVEIRSDRDSNRNGLGHSDRRAQLPQAENPRADRQSLYLLFPRNSVAGAAIFSVLRRFALCKCICWNDGRYRLSAERWRFRGGDRPRRPAKHRRGTKRGRLCTGLQQVPDNDLFSDPAGAEKGTIICMLLSDAGQIACWPKIKPHLTAGKTLYYSHGFAINWSDRTGVVPPKDIDVIMVAPKGSGTSLRTMFCEGRGLNCSYAVYQDASGKAEEKTIAFGIGIGAGYLFKTTFQREATSDLTGERGSLMGAIEGLLEAQYDVLRENGHSPSEAFNETVEELTQSLGPLFGAKGMDWMYANCSTTAQRGALDWAPRFREAIKPVMEWLYYSVKTGNEAQISIDKNSQADYREKLNAELEAMRNKEMWQAGVTVRKLRPENN